jgi:hypothetical protein
MSGIASGRVDTPFRLLVTGSRLWTDHQLVAAVLDGFWVDHHDRLVVVHGACRYGADAIADQWAASHGVTVQRFPADWRRYGRMAGMIRNTTMVATDPHRCVAFIHRHSPGATHCAETARHAGIPTTYYRSTDPLRADTPVRRRQPAVGGRYLPTGGDR